MNKHKKSICIVLLLLTMSLLFGCMPETITGNGNFETSFLPTETVQLPLETADTANGSDNSASEPDGTHQSAAASIPSDSTGLTVRFLDVGQADSALLACDGHYMLIDGGNRDDSSLLYTV